MNLKLIIFLFIFIFLSTPFSISQKKTLYEVDPSYQLKSEKRLFELLNAEREKLGLTKLIINSKLSKIALKHSIKMGENKKLSHTHKNYKSLAERFVDEGLYFISSGENVAFSSTVDPEIIHEGFMKSPSHKKNILLRSFSHVGIKMYNTEDGIYTTQEFSQLFKPLENSSIKNYLIERMQNYTQNEWGHIPIVLEKIDKNIFSKDLDDSKKMENNPRLYAYEKFNITSPDLDALFLNIYSYLKYARILSFSVDVSFKRNNEYRGGAYKISCAFNKADFFDGLTEKEVEKIIIQKINSLRAKKGKQAFIINVAKNKIAKQNMEIYYQNKLKKKKSYFGQDVLIYNTRRPIMIPEMYKSMDLLFLDNETIGISVYYPVLHGKNSNYCIISIHI